MTIKTEKAAKKKLKEIDILEVDKGEDLSRHEFHHVYAVSKIFENVSFKQSSFLSCYFRNCRFIKCDFTGAMFKDSNLSGSTFQGSIFRYTSWEKTIVDAYILKACLPSEENLAMKMVRNLRINFGQMGDPDGVNAAARLEVWLTGQHFRKGRHQQRSIL